MGIRGLNNLIKKYAPDAISEKDISLYKGSKVAIDCSILLYKFKYASRAPNSHIIGIANRIKYYFMNGILPIFVFDGVPPAAKKNVLVKRQANKERMYTRLELLREKIPENNEEEKLIKDEIEKITSQLIVIKKKDIEECKEFLELSGIPYCTAPEDAEKYCAFLQKNGLVDYTITDDTDATTFGCKKILKTGISRYITEIDTDIILFKFDMDMNSFIDFCILSGCDYTEPIPQIGPVTSFNLIRKHKRIEEVLDVINKKSDNFDYAVCRKIFTEFDYAVPEEFTKKKADKEKINLFLNDKEIKENIISKFIKIVI
jgi:flap endonuclease-1|tara:strand:+ start:12253 stop:13200 length:948 start_codon:yes stop_codon:yes gene_type:complete